MDPILLQKQIRDNSEELNKYLVDLKSWEEEMKRKEQELYGGPENEEDEVLPPVRSKIKKVSVSSVKEASPLKEQEQPKPRIQSSDYTAWDKFDVEQACEEIEKVIVSSPSTEEAKKKNIEEAIYEKENGNMLVRAGKWKEAMECYARAISYDGSNAIFYANRAQCALKLEMWQQVIDDCTKALSIEAGYVKAFLRRSTARLKLKNYQGAVDDLTKALSLEPGNVEAKKSLLEARNQLGKSKISTMFASSPSKNSQASQEADNSVIVAISKPLHLRSKAPLRRIPVEEDGVLPDLQPAKPSGDVPSKAPAPLPKPAPSRTSKAPRLPPKQPPTPTQLEPDFLETVPPPPKSSVQFMLAWPQLRPLHRYAYLSQISGLELAPLFGDSLESKVLSEVLAALSAAPEKSRLFEYLEGLSQARRFSTLTLFMSQQDKDVVRELLQRCVSEDQCKQEQVTLLQQKYEL